MSREHLASMIHESVARYGDKIAMKYKEGGSWQSISYGEMGRKIRCIAKALLEIGVQENDMISTFSQNRPEWHLADYAILSIRAVSVPIYATNTAKQAEYIVNDAKVKIIFAGDQGQYDKVMSFIQSTPQVKKVIVFDKTIKLTGNISIHLDDFIKTGEASKKEQELDKRIESGKPEELATLIYTSGTTGDPKGVMLTHANMCSQFIAIDKHFDVDSSDSSLCFLPLSHAYERTWSNYVFRQGAENNYMANQKEIVAYLSEVKPSCMVSVPRLYEKIYATVHDGVEKAGGIKKKLFNWAFETGKKYAYKKKDKAFVGPLLAAKHALADKLVLSKLRDVVGGYKKFFSAGGAALSKDIEEFFFACGVLVCQGYGLTETSPMSTCNRPREYKFGTVGKAIYGTQMRVSDEGELQIKGPNLMKGYYNKPEATAEIFTKDGWLKTGDVGVIDEEGFIRITDRIKDLIITSQGKNIAPQHIEGVVGMDHYIEQIATIGDKRNYIAALIVPSFEALEKYAKDNGIAYSGREELVTRPEIIKFFRDRIDKQSAELANYEKIKRFTLMPREFTQDGGELTPTLKVKRKVIMQKYADVIENMYAGKDSD